MIQSGIDHSSDATIVAVVTMIDDTQSHFEISQTQDRNRQYHVSLKDHIFNFTNFFDKVSLYPPSVEPFNAVTDTVNVRCRKCRKNYPSELFANPGSNSLYATCLDCRTEEHARRYPTVFEPTTIQGPSEYLGKIYNFWIILILMR